MGYLGSMRYLLMQHSFMKIKFFLTQMLLCSFIWLKSCILIYPMNKSWHFWGLFLGQKMVKIRNSLYYSNISILSTLLSCLSSHSTCNRWWFWVGFWQVFINELENVSKNDIFDFLLLQFILYSLAADRSILAILENLNIFDQFEAPLVLEKRTLLNRE